MFGRTANSSSPTTIAPSDPGIGSGNGSFVIWATPGPAIISVLYADAESEVAQAAAGAFSVTGEPDGPPMRPGATMADAGSGIQAALAIAAAYAQKLRTGEGQLIELSMQEAMTYYLRTAISRTNFGEVPTPRMGNSVGPTMSLYPCAPGGPNDYVYIMALTPRMWQQFCNAIERPDLLEDERFKKAALRRENAEPLSEIVAAWTAQHTKHDAMRILAGAGVPAGAVFDTLDLFNDPHLNERGFVKTVEHPSLGPIRLLGWPPRMSASEVDIIPAPFLGAQTSEVLAEDLGLSAEEVEALRAQGVLGEEYSLE